MDVLLIIFLLGALGIAIAFYAIREDKQDKEIQRMIDNAVDRDKDGVILEGTAFERKVAKPVKKAPAKKKAVAAKPKAKPKTKSKTVAKPKKKAPAKKKPVAKKKSR